MSRRLSRDEMVEKGLAAATRSEEAFRAGKRTGPWIYKSQVRNGRSKVQHKEVQAWNIPHLKARLIVDNARIEQAISIEMIGRVMKGHLRSPREDQ